MSLLFFFIFFCNKHTFFFARAVRAVLARVFVASSASCLILRAPAHHNDRRTLEVPGCSSALCLGFSCCRGRASGELGLLRCRCGCLRPALCCVRLSIAPSSRRRRATTTGGRPAAQAERQQSSKGSCLAHLPPFWRSTTGLPARGACGSLLFRQDKKRKQLPTKNNVEK